MEATGVGRWALVAVTLSLVGGAVRPLLKRDYSIPEGVEEARMFRVTDRRTVQISVPADTAFVELQVVSVVHRSDNYDPATEHAFAFDAALRSTSGQWLYKWTVQASSRVSLEHFPPVRGDRRGAELLGSTDWLTDARTITLPVGPLDHRRNALLILRAKGRSELLVRGFSVRHVRNRMTVTGTRGRDYELRRVRLSTFRRHMDSRRRQSDVPSPSRFLPNDRLVLTVTGAMTLGLQSVTDCVFHVVDGLHLADSAPRELRLSGGMESTLNLPDRGLRSVAFESEGSCLLHIRASEFEAPNIVDVDTENAGGGRVFVVPRRHYSDWTPLHPTKPVVSRVEPGERALKVTFRRIRTPAAEHDRRRFDATVVTVLTDGKRITTPMRKRYTWSDYEHQGDQAMSVPQFLTLKVPTNADHVEIFGDQDTVVHLAVESGLPDELAPPYDTLMPPGAVWFGAPKRSNAWAPIVPSNRAELQADKRVRAMQYQLRLISDGKAKATAKDAWLAALTQKGAPGGASDVDTVSLSGKGARLPAAIAASELTPVGAHAVERVLVQEDLSAADAKDVTAAWTRVDKGRDVVVRAKDGGVLDVIVRVPPPALGGDVRVMVDGKESAVVRATTTTQELHLRVPAGKHHVEVMGVSADGMAYVDAAPAARGSVMRRRATVALRRGETLTYQIPKTQDGRVALLLQVVTMDAGQSWVMPWNVFGNEGQDRTPHLIANGAVEGQGGHDKVALLWDQLAESSRAGWGEGRIILGAPASPTLRTVRLRLAGGTADRVWVRAVLFGKPQEARPDRITMERRSGP